MLSHEKLKSNITEIQYEIDYSNKELSNLSDFLSKLENTSIPNINEAINILTAVLSITQDEVLSFIEEIVTNALQYVYGEDYSFKIDFEIKRNQPEVKMYPVKGDLDYYPPAFNCGVGVIDVCSFALRYALFALMEPKPASIMLHDEPFRHVHGEEENKRLGMMVKYLSDMLGIQVIMVSGESALSEYADKVFSVTIENGISKVR